jgi:hypothetical protein
MSTLNTMVPFEVLYHNAPLRRDQQSIFQFSVPSRVSNCGEGLESPANGFSFSQLISRNPIEAERGDLPGRDGVRKRRTFL